MDTKERIVSLRLIAKAKRHPTFARTIGVMNLNGCLSKGGKRMKAKETLLSEDRVKEILGIDDFRT